MTTETKSKRCTCGSEMYAGPSGWICSTCDARIKPYFGKRPKDAEKIIAHDEAEPEECETCCGTGLVDCTECDGDGHYECPHCGSDCEECDDGKVPCPDCQ